MAFDPEKFLKDYQIPYTTVGENCSKGWININCPFCHDTMFHGGFNIEKGYYNCWKCGGIYLLKVISTLIKSNYKHTRQVIKKYDVRRLNLPNFSYFSKREYQVVSSKLKTIFPTNSDKLDKEHMNYLDKRNFDPEKLICEFGLVGTGPFGDYKFRIIAPIFFNKKLVSYQGRDITGISEIRYKVCKKENEVIHFKDILYNMDNSMKNDKVIITEGITDVWRMGDGSICTFGIEYTKKQVICVKERFNTAFILFDREPEKSIIQAEKLAWDLSGIGVKTEIIEIDTDDPAEMEELDAKYLRKDLLGY